MRDWRWLRLACLLYAGVARADPQEAEELPPEVAELRQRAQGEPGGPLQAALAEQVLGCYATEGHAVSAQDRALVQQAAGALLNQLGALLPPTGCRGSAEAGCVARIRGSSCADLAARLTSAPAGPPAPWAKAFANRVSARLLSCYRDESGPRVADPQPRLEALRAELAQALVLLTAGGTCKVQPERAAGCAAAVATLPCSSLAEALSPEATGVAEALLRRCEDLLDCGDGRIPGE